MRFGLIGAGSIGVLRAAALQGTPGVRLTAIHDLDHDRARSLAPDAVFHDTAEKLFQSPDVDAIVISTPPESHEVLATAALQSGKHVLVEKPMAPTAAACRRMVQAALDCRRLLSVGYNHRYFAATKLVRDLVASGELGKLTHVRAYAGHVGLAEFKAPWMYDPQVMGGGALYDNGTHIIDLARYVMGDADEVFGMVSSAVWGIDGAEDNGFALLRSEAGVVADLQASWSEWKGYRFHIEAYGDRGMARAYYAPMMATVIRLDRPGGKRRTKRYFYPRTILREKLRGWQSTVIDTFVEEFSEFVQAAAGEVRGDSRIALGADGLRAVEIAEGVRSSSQTGERVRLPPLPQSSTGGGSAAPQA